ncbi:MAG: zinc metalloprotease HtpX [Candidatus Nezhaarchaeota archaeon]|nr:zinc metalloprotease HtpX [Candidatus Nezhaarchaeota archaeon]MCX8141583.1 zinc metalloprotease HtpX [Candidatus Nezhaarchaeota archaeon]MDW8049850.1 zinc metalloprotease HtpX [Nitrososphaerota archaeon]
MTVLTLLFAAVGYAIGSVVGDPLFYTIIAAIIAAIFNVTAFLFSDRFVLAATGARLVTPNEAPKLHAIVERVAKSAGIPKPKVAIINKDVPNAFATGRSPNRGVVAVTEGLLRSLSDDEIEAVIGHEIAHIKHRDTLIMTLAATIAGAIAYLAFIGRWALMFGGGSRDRGAGASLLALIALIVAPIAASLVQLAISRAGEYRADEGAAHVTRKPLSLARALSKIEMIVRRRPMSDAMPSTAPLWIVNPIRGDAIAELFSTHPPTEKRIARLKKIAEQTGSLS